MEIRPLYPAAYAGKRFTARYQTAGYYDIRAQKDGFHIEHRPFPSPVWRSFDDEFFGECPEDPVAFGAFEGDTLVGYAEGSRESWNNRFRLSNICVFDDAVRGRRCASRWAKSCDPAPCPARRFVVCCSNSPPRREGRRAPCTARLKSAKMSCTATRSTS